MNFLRYAVQVVRTRLLYVFLIFLLIILFVFNVGGRVEGYIAAVLEVPLLFLTWKIVESTREISINLRGLVLTLIFPINAFIFTILRSIAIGKDPSFIYFHPFYLALLIGPICWILELIISKI